MKKTKSRSLEPLLFLDLQDWSDLCREDRMFFHSGTASMHASSGC